jgi:IS30 family transposase
VFNIEIQNHIRVLTEADFSPEQIVRKSKKDGVSCVSHETI